MSKLWRRRQGPTAETNSMDGRLLAFDADGSTDEQLREVYDFLALAHAHDRPDRELNEPDQDRYDKFVASLFRRSSPGSNGRMNLYLVRSGSRIVVSVACTVGGDADRDLAIVDITVHPQQRRQGFGTAVLRTVLPGIRATGRTRIGAAVRSGDSEMWAWGVGFRPVVRQACQHLLVAEADPALWQDMPVPAGYQLRTWDDSTPEELLESYARARRAFEDLIDPRLAARKPDWTAERIRADEADSAAQRAECRVVVAVHEATGEVVGMTETAVFPGEPETVTQGYTAVVREHQGNGLGRAMKAAMMRRMLTEQPGIVRVRTRAFGPHMERTNRELGYQTVTEHAFVEATIEKLESTLAAFS